MCPCCNFLTNILRSSLHSLLSTGRKSCYSRRLFIFTHPKVTPNTFFSCADSSSYGTLPHGFGHSTPRCSHHHSDACIHCTCASTSQSGNSVATLSISPAAACAMFPATPAPPDATAAPEATAVDVTFFAVCVMLALESEGDPLRSPCTSSGIFLMSRYRCAIPP